MFKRLLVVSFLLVLSVSAHGNVFCAQLFSRPVEVQPREFVTNLVNFETPLSYETGYHPHSKFFFVVTGKAIVEVNGEQVYLIPGQFLYIPPGAPYRFTESSRDFEFYEGYDVRPQDVAWSRGEPVNPGGPMLIRETNRMKWKQWDPEHAVMTKFMMNGKQGVDARVTAGLAQIPAKGELANHYHREAEYYVVTKGEGVIEIDGHRTPLYPGRVIYIPGNSTHHTTNPTNKPLELLFIFNEPNFSNIIYKFL